MKVLQVLLSLGAGGTEGFIANLSVSLARAGISVRVYLIAGIEGERGRLLYDRMVDAGVEVVGAVPRKPGITLSKLWSIVKLPFMLRRWRPDIMQVNHNGIEMACAVAKRLAFGRGGKYVRRLPDTRMPEAKRSSIVNRTIHRACDLTIACSEAVYRACESVYDDSLSASLVTIPNGGLLLEHVPDEAERAEARRVIGLADDVFAIAHVGRMMGDINTDAFSLTCSQKAHDVLLNAYAAVFGGRDGHSLLLVGDGNLRPQLEQLASSLEIREQVHFLGSQPEPWTALQAADMFCFPSRYEGLPNVLPEAASCALPVVASDIPEISGIAPESGWLLAPADDIPAFSESMRNVHDNIDRYRSLAIENATVFRERFSMELCARSYVDSYMGLADDR